MSNRIQLLVVDDHSLVRSGFRLLLESIPDFEVVADAANGDAAIELIEKAPPDVVITDIAMPGMTGIELVRRIVQSWPTTRCIVLSMHKTAPYVRSSMAAGAAGYLLKDSVDAELELAVRSVMRGDTYLSPPVAGLLIENNEDELELTPRQTEVLKAMAEGSTTREIALQLGLSPKTVETHRAQLMKRLDIFDVAGLVRYALKNGLVSLD